MHSITISPNKMRLFKKTKIKIEIFCYREKDGSSKVMNTPSSTNKPLQPKKIFSR